MKTLSDSHKKNISKGLKGRKFSSSHKRKLSIAAKSRTYYPASDETRRKMSLAATGHAVSIKTRRKIALTKIGKSRSIETRTKISKTKKGTPAWNKGVPCKEETKKKLSQYKGKKNARFGTHHTQETKTKISNAQKGEKGFNWRGGSSFEPYDPRFGKGLKHQIRVRDKFTCQICKKKQKETTFPIHHIDYNKQNSVPINLITLCHKCHSTTGMHRDYWKIQLTCFQNSRKVDNHEKEKRIL